MLHNLAFEAVHKDAFRYSFLPRCNTVQRFSDLYKSTSRKDGMSTRRMGGSTNANGYPSLPSACPQAAVPILVLSDVFRQFELKNGTPVGARRRPNPTVVVLDKSTGRWRIQMGTSPISTYKRRRRYTFLSCVHFRSSPCRQACEFAIVR
jgi:hypothetical protein